MTDIAYKRKLTKALFREARSYCTWQEMAEAAVALRAELEEARLLVERLANGTPGMVSDNGFVKAVDIRAAQQYLIAHPAGMSEQLVQLSADMAVFYNVDQGEVIGNLQSAMTGYTRSLREYGIVLSDTNIKLEALALGIVLIVHFFPIW